MVKPQPELPTVPEAFLRSEYEGWLEEAIKTPVEPLPENAPRHPNPKLHFLILVLKRHAGNNLSKLTAYEVCSASPFLPFPVKTTLREGINRVQIRNGNTTP